jgi:hypothetical protein
MEGKRGRPPVNPVWVQWAKERSGMYSFEELYNLFQVAFPDANVSQIGFSSIYRKAGVKANVGKKVDNAVETIALITRHMKPHETKIYAARYGVSYEAVERYKRRKITRAKRPK